MLQAIKDYVDVNVPRPIIDRAQTILRYIMYRNTARYQVPRAEAPGLLRCCVAYTDNGGFCVPLSSRHDPVAQRVLHGRTYEPKTIDFLTANIGDGDMIHAGTYFGDFLPSLSRACPPGFKIWAFEPNVENYRCAQITCIINGINNVELTNAGLGERTASARMMTIDNRGRGRGGASRLLTDDAAGTDHSTENVDVIALDDVIPEDRHISLLQLDVEHYEKACLTGALKTIARCMPVLMLERLPQQDWFEHHILSLGYTLTQRVHQNHVLLPTKTRD